MNKEITDKLADYIKDDVVENTKKSIIDYIENEMLLRQVKLRNMHDMIVVMIFCDTFQTIETKFLEEFKQGNYEKCFNLLVELDRPLDDIFQKVRLDKTEAKIANKLQIIFERIQILFAKIADFKYLSPKNKENK